MDIFDRSKAGDDETPPHEKAVCEEDHIEVPDERPILDAVQYSDSWDYDWLIIEDPLDPDQWIRMPADASMEVKQ